MTRFRAAVLGVFMVTFVGCGGPSANERENRKAFEMLLTAISIKNAKELEKDATRIDERHREGRLSDRRHKDLLGIIKEARAGDWGKAENMAYEFRETYAFFR